MGLYFVFVSIFVCTLCKEAVKEINEDELEETTEETFPVDDFSELLPKLNNLDLEITKILGSMSPEKSQGDQLVLNIQGYVMGLGPLIHSMAAEKAEVLMIAKSIYRQGAPKFLSTPINSEVVQKSFGWDEIKMKVLHTVYDCAVKTWRNFLNMCERHRVEN